MDLGGASYLRLAPEGSWLSHQYSPQEVFETLDSICQGSDNNEFGSVNQKWTHRITLYWMKIAEFFARSAKAGLARPGRYSPDVEYNFNLDWSYPENSDIATLSFESMKVYSSDKTRSQIVLGITKTTTSPAQIDEIRLIVDKEEDLTGNDPVDLVISSHIPPYPAEPNLTFEFSIANGRIHRLYRLEFPKGRTTKIEREVETGEVAKAFWIKDPDDLEEDLDLEEDP